MRPEVVCFGEILWDFFETPRRGDERGRVTHASHASHASHVSHVSHVTIARAFRRELGGAPANVATGLARLGVRTAVVGGVGRDRFGQALLAHLREDGIDVRFVVKLPNRTGVTFVMRDARGEPEFLFFRHESADVSLRAEHVTPAMGRAGWALVGTSTLMTGELRRATLRFLDSVKRAGTHLMVDLNVRTHLWSSPREMRAFIGELVERADLVKASDADLRAVSGKAGPHWLERHAPQASWLITRGRGMASAIGQHGVVHAPALRARCVDATGAGDAFIAGSLATLVRAGALPGSTRWRDAAVWRVALRVGHLMGKKAVSRPGAVAALRDLAQARTVIDRVRRSAP